MPVYDYQGERVEAVQFSSFADHPYVRQLKPGEFALELGTDATAQARKAEEERAAAAALDQPGEAPRLVRRGDMLVSRPAGHGELTVEIVPATDFLAKAKYVGVRSAELSAGMSASPEHAALRKQRIEEDLDRQVEARERLERETEERRAAGDANPERNEPIPMPTTGEPGSPQAATRGRPGEDGTSHDKREREATPQRAGADGNRSTKPDQPDPDAHRAQTHKAKAR